MTDDTSSRRRFLALGTLATAAAAVTTVGVGQVTAGPAGATTPSPSPTPIRFVSEFGATGNGRDDDTEAIQAAIDWSVDHQTIVGFAPGFYAVRSLRLTRQTRLVGYGVSTTRFARTGHFGGVVLMPLDVADTTPLVVIDSQGTGVQIQDIVIDGFNAMVNTGDPSTVSSWPIRVGLEVQGGIEVRLNTVRVFRFRGTGILVKQLNNSQWTDVYVDNCGSDTAAAMVVSSPATSVSNFLLFDGLTIERSGNTALAIAAGPDPIADFVSGVTFVGLHVEANTDGPTSHLNTKPLIDIGNVRDITFVTPHILGAPVPLIDYHQRSPVDTKRPGDPGGDGGDQLGGVTLLGGQLQQHGASDSAKRIASIRATGNGRGLSIGHVRFASLWCPAVLLEASFQFDAAISSCSFRDAGAGAVDFVVDRRPAAAEFYSPRRVYGDTVVVGGRLRVRAGAGVPAPTLEKTTDSVTAAWGGAPGTDAAGTIRLTVHGDLPVAGFVEVRFGASYQTAPVVTLTPLSAAAAGAGLWVDVAADGTKMTIRTTKPASQATGAIAFSYLVVGVL